MHCDRARGTSPHELFKNPRHRELMMLLSECVRAIIYGDLLFLCMVQSKEMFAIQILW